MMRAITMILEREGPMTTPRLHKELRRCGFKIEDRDLRMLLAELSQDGVITFDKNDRWMLPMREEEQDVM